MKINIYWAKIFSVYLCTGLLLSSNVYAKKESDTELDQQMVINTRILEKNVSKQAGLGICYAHSSALIYETLYEEYYRKKVEISPLFLAFHVATHGYKTKKLRKRKHKKKSLLEKITSGYFSNTFKDISGMTPLPKLYVEDFLLAFGKTKSLKSSLEKVVSFFEKYEESHEKKLINLFEKQEEKKPPFTLKRTVDELDLSLPEAKTLYQYILTCGFTKKNGQFINSHTKTLYNFFLHNSRKMNNKESLKKLNFVKLSSYYRSGSGKKTLLKLLEKNFTADKDLPIAISYTVKNLINNNLDNGTHSSFIFGKGFHKGTRYWLIRNSWGGKGVDGILPPFPENKDLLNSKDIDGDFWVNDAQLKRTWETGGAVHILKLKEKALKSISPIVKKIP